MGWDGAPCYWAVNWPIVSGPDDQLMNTERWWCDK